MPVQRTPPPHLQKNHAPAPPIEESLSSPSAAFRPIHQPVRRSLPDGTLPPLEPTQPIASSSTLPPAPPVTEGTEEDEEMEIDQLVEEIPLQAEKSMTPPLEESIPPPPVTPKQSLASRRMSVKKTPAAVLDEPVVPIPMEPGQEVDYGKHHQVLLQALEVAVRKGANKWTSTDLKQCFPLLAAREPAAMEAVWARSAQAIRTNILNQATDLFEHYKTGPALQLLNQTIQEAKEYASTSGAKPRSDRWRPDITPAALTAANNLPLYDEAYTRLREEYISLHEDCAKRYQSITAKKAQLAVLESSVSDGVVELEETIKVLEGFPNESMINWTEDFQGKSAGLRTA